MTEEQIALARRAVACTGWKWMPGMLVVGSTRFGEWPFRVCHLSALNLRTDPGALPDFDDAATMGCLLALYENTRTTLTCPDPVYTYAAAYGLLHPRTVEALVVAWEAAP